MSRKCSAGRRDVRRGAGVKNSTKRLCDFAVAHKRHFIHARTSRVSEFLGTRLWRKSDFDFQTKREKFRGGEVADVKEQKEGNIPNVNGEKASDRERWRIENVQLPLHGMFWNKFSHSSAGRRVGRRGREVVAQSNRPLLVVLPLGLYSPSPPRVDRYHRRVQ